MSLLDDVSIVVTPNGYKAGELYAVVPTDALGSEQVTNGDYTEAGVGNVISQSGGVLVNDSNRLKITSDGSGGYSRGVWETNGSQGERFIIKADVISTSGTVRFIDISNNASSSDLVAGSTYEKIVTLGSSGKQVGFGGLNDLSFEIILDNVSLKEITGADMDVTRATAGTRVDEDGLVNYAEIIGSDGVTNGDFATDTDWTKNASWTIANGKASYDGSSSGHRIKQNIPLTIGKKYTASLDILDSSGRFRMSVDGGSSSYSTYTTGNGTYTFEFTSSSVEFSIRGSMSDSANTFSIDNVSVKEVTRDNVPRIDYTGGGCPHILAEPQRTNELTQSNQFDTTWSQSGTLTSGQDGVGGSTDAWKFENPNATSGLHQNDTTSGVQTFSAYFKKNSNYGVRFFAFGSVNCSTYFDLDNGAVVSSINSTAKVESAGADWFRCSMTFDQTNTQCYFYVTNNTSTQVVGNITLQYAQLEQGSYATSYIPTSGSTVTRNQDIFTRDGIGSLINSTEGVLFVEMAALSDDLTFRSISLNDGTNTNSVGIRYRTNSNRINAIIKDGNGVTFQMNFDVSDITQFKKIALKYKSGDNSLYINGTEVVTNSSTFSFTSALNDASFNRGDGNDDFFGKVKQLQVYTTALTDAQLTSLTS